MWWSISAELSQTAGQICTLHIAAESGSNGGVLEQACSASSSDLYKYGVLISSRKSNVPFFRGQIAWSFKWDWLELQIRDQLEHKEQHVGTAYGEIMAAYVLFAFNIKPS